MKGKRLKTYTYDGFTGTLAQWSRRTGISWGALKGRIMRYGTSDSALSKVFSPKTENGTGSGVLYTFDGFTGNLSQWSERIGISWCTLKRRIRRYGTSDSALRKVFGPEMENGPGSGALYTFDGFTGNLTQWAKRLGLSTRCLRRRIRKYGTSDSALSKVFNPEKENGPSSGVQYTFDGFTGNLTQWSKRLGVSKNALRSRIEKHGTSDDALKKVFTCVRNFSDRAAKFVEHNGKTMCLKDWAKMAGVPVHAFRQRIGRYGYTIDEAMIKRPKYGRGGRENWMKKFGGKRMVIDGVEDNITGHAKRHGNTYANVKDRIRCGWNLAESIVTPKVSDKTPYIAASRRRKELASIGVIF